MSLRGAKVAAPIALALGTSAMVVWQVSHVTALWDLSYILNTAQKIAGGYLPYHDFPLPHAPWTFAVQALLIRLFGARYPLVVAYTALEGFAGTLITYRICVMVLSGRAGWPRATALILTAPLAVLGLGVILPQPFYDYDVCLLVLIAVWVLLEAERRDALWPALLAGALLPLPALAKQNVGIAFAGLDALLASALLVRSPRTRWVCFVLGAVGAVLGIFAVLHWSVGIHNIRYWTITYARARRLTTTVDLSSVESLRADLTAAALFAGVSVIALGRWVRALNLTRTLIGTLIAVLALASLLVAADNLLFGLAIWPVVELAAVGAAVGSLVSGDWGVGRQLPILIAGVTFASALSQGLEGSTYGIWPLLAIAIASLLALAGRSISKPGPWWPPVVAGAFAIVILIPGIPYVVTEHRLGYLRLPPTAVVHSSTPRLTGMSAPGPYITHLDQAVAYAERNIPAGQAILAYPGEDPIYFALNRTPRYPVLLFDLTVNPYGAPELRRLEMQYDVRWVLVKRDCQIRCEALADMGCTPRILTEGFRLVAAVGGYEFYRREAATLGPSRVAGC